MASRLASKVMAVGWVGTSLGVVGAYRYQKVQQEQAKLPSNKLWSFKDTPSGGKKNVIVIGGGVVGVTGAAV